MADDRWRRIEPVYHDALVLDADARAAFLAEACGGDDTLRREVESLLAQPATAGGFLDGPAVAVAAGMVSDPGVSMMTGRRLGAYQLQALLGRGGMGEVYRARDTKLGRDVAIKILPRAFTADPDRLARFEREARVLASLNHPNIGAIYGVKDVDGVRALVLELVEGETLAEMIMPGTICRNTYVPRANETPGMATGPLKVRTSAPPDGCALWTVIENVWKSSWPSPFSRRRIPASGRRGVKRPQELASPEQL